MKFVRLLVLSLILHFSVLAQTNYKEGFVVKSTGDTLRGYINYREWDKTPDYIEFKASLTDKVPAKIFPVTLRAFEINGLDSYITYIGMVSMDKNIFPDLPTSFDDSVTQDTVFMQVIYQGIPLSLLEQSDKLKTRLFVRENNEQPIELQFHEYYVDNRATNSVKSFADVLKPLAQKYNPQNSNLEQAIDRTIFRESDLQQIIKLINNDKSKQHSGSTNSRFFAGVVINQATTQFKGIYRGKVYSYIPQLDAGVDVFLNKNTQRFFFRGQISLSAAQPRFNTENLNPSPSSEYQFDQYTASLSLQPTFNVYNTDTFKLYLAAGVGVNYSYYFNNLYTVNTSAGKVQYENYYELSNLWTNFPLKTGVVINKKIEVFATYTPSAQLTRYFYFSESNSNLGLGVHYLFGK
jgi:hypothetical protein